MTAPVRDRLIEVASELVSIPSVTGEEAAIAAHLAERCAALGLRTDLQEVEPGRPNVVATLPGRAGPRMLLTGHMDVVPPGAGWTSDPFEPQLVDGRLVGRGAADMKGGVAAMLVALENIVADGYEPAGDVVFAAVVGEEEDQVGTASLIASGFTADCAIVGEPTEAKVVRGHKGCVAARVEFRGQAAHASTPRAGVNAVEQAAEVVSELRRTAARLEAAAHPAFGPASISVGTISGGSRPYIVPDFCQIEVDRRLIPGETIDTAIDEVNAAVAAVMERSGHIDYDLTVTAGALPFELSADHALVRSVLEATTSNGWPAELALWDAVSDASILVNDGGIPTVIYGPGSIAGAAHRPNEYVEIAELVRVQQAYERLLRDSAWLSDSGNHDA